MKIRSNVHFWLKWTAKLDLKFNWHLGQQMHRQGKLLSLLRLILIRRNKHGSLTFLVKASNRVNIFHEPKIKNEIRWFDPDEVIDFPVTRTQLLKVHSKYLHRGHWVFFRMYNMEGKIHSPRGFLKHTFQMQTSGGFAIFNFGSVSPLNFWSVAVECA